jgi:hypothetical protein
MDDDVTRLGLGRDELIRHGRSFGEFVRSVALG